MATNLLELILIKLFCDIFKAINEVFRYIKQSSNHLTKKSDR